MGREADRSGYLRARALRREMTPPEVRLWVRLRGRKSVEFSVRRQHPVGPYVLDFYCEAADLAIEVDGAHHRFDEAIAKDLRRDAWLLAEGITTVRVDAGEVMADVDSVAERILNLIRGRLELPPEAGA